MKTMVIMKRELLGGIVSQRSDNQYFSANDLERIGEMYRANNGMSKFSMQSFFALESTKEFVEALEKKHNVKARITTRGKQGGTWIHPLLFIDMALYISPELKVEVYGWLFDHLIKNRHASGDTYKDMCAAIYILTTNKRNFEKRIARIADYIKEKCGVEDWNTATEEQLKTRELIHVSIKLLCNVLRSVDQAVRIGVKEHTGLD